MCKKSLSSPKETPENRNQRESLEAVPPSNASVKHHRSFSVQGRTESQVIDGKGSDDLMSVEAGPLGNHSHLQMCRLCSVHSSAAVIQNFTVNSTIKSKRRERGKRYMAGFVLHLFFFFNHKPTVLQKTIFH